MNKLNSLNSGRILILSCTAAMGLFFLWATWAQLDQITRANGQVIASSRNQVIQSPDGGVVQEILVKEGSIVKKGQVLIRFDKARLEAAYFETRAKDASLLATIARLKAEVYGGVPKFPPELAHYPEIHANEENLFKKRQEALHEELAVLDKSQVLVKEELDMNTPLLKTGDVSRADIIKLQRQLAEIQGQISNRKNKYLQDSQAELSKTYEDLAGVEQILAERKDQLQHTVLISPMDGIVRNVRITTLGGVARPADEIMQIVPIEDVLLIEAKVKSSDIGFIKLGLPASIKLDAYDYSIYGSLNGTVSYISADTLSDENRSSNEPPSYRVQVKTSASSLQNVGGKRIEIQPGMTATVEIKTGSKSVWKYLTKPITKTLSESLGER